MTEKRLDLFEVVDFLIPIALIEVFILCNGVLLVLILDWLKVI